MRQVTLPSGATLKVGLAPFADALVLQQACLRELRHISVGRSIPMENMLKDMFCTAYASPEVQAAMKPVILRSTYNDAKIDLNSPDMFEPVLARQDYFQVLAEVAQDNIGPFMSYLFAEYRKRAFAETERAPPAST